MYPRGTILTWLVFFRLEDANSLIPISSKGKESYFVALFTVKYFEYNSINYSLGFKPDLFSPYVLHVQNVEALIRYELRVPSLCLTCLDRQSSNKMNKACWAILLALSVCFYYYYFLFFF